MSMAMQKRLKEIYLASEFARENLSFRETVGLILEKHGYERDAILLGKDVDLEKIEKDFVRAVSGEPLGYVIGKVPFFREEYFVGEGVLIPRCDSEVLVETAIKVIPEGTHFLDICTGSGCIGISILKAREDLTATLLDKSPTALGWAKRNVVENGVEGRCEVRLFDLMKEELPHSSALVMNPPYITEEEMNTLPENVKREPSLALFGGEDGLDFYRRVKALSPDRTLVFEIGRGQGGALLELFEGGKIIKDLSGNDRVFLKVK